MRKKVLYCLLRVSEKFDESTVTKFVYIHWLGARLPFFHKGQISPHIGPVKDFIGQSHVSLTASTLDEITPVLVREKVLDTMGTGSRVLDETGNSQIRSQARGQQVENVQSTGRRVQNEEDLVFDDSVMSAIHEVRRDGDPTHWVLAGYEDPNSTKIVLLAKGEGNVEELKSHLNDGIVAYGLIRKTHQFDNSMTVKFCYIRWVGPNIPRMLRAKLGVHFASARKTFHPFHADVQAEHSGEISEEIVENVISHASGTKVNVLEGQSSPQTINRNPSKTSNSPTPRPLKTSNTNQDQPPPCRLANEDEVKGFIHSVRSDEDPTDWCLITYDAPKSNTLVALGRGTGGINEMTSHIKDDIVAYGLLRTRNQFDLSSTVKFVFIDWRGSQIHFMQRANLGTHSGVVTDLFRPYHVDIQTSDLHDLSENVIMDKIKYAAGNKNWVLG